jgi:hypothetical protein
MAQENQIEGDFYEASYFGITILYQKSSNYVNATKLCADCNRHYFHWKSNKQSMVLFHEFTKFYSSAYPPEFQIFSGTHQVRGSYVHPDLVAAIAIWIDPAFHLRVSQLIRSIHEIKLTMMVQQHVQEKEELEFNHLMEMDAAHQTTYPPSYYIIMKKNNGIEAFPYKVIKCSKSQRQICLKRFMKDFPNGIILVDAMIAADGKEVHSKVKSLTGRLSFNHNNLQFLCSEKEAVKDIMLLINQ